MENSFFFNAGKFVKKHPYFCIIIIAVLLYFIFSDNEKTAHKKKVCLNALDIKKDKRTFFLATENKDYSRCLNDSTYYIAYQLPKKIEAIKIRISKFNEHQKKLNNEVLIQNKSQYKQVDMNEFLKGNFDSFLSIKNSEALDKKIYFLSKKFYPTKTEKINEVIIDNLLTAGFFNPKIENKFTYGHHNRHDFFFYDYPYEVREDESIFVWIYGSFQKEPGSILNTAKFYIDDVIFVPIYWPDEVLVSNVISYHAKVNRLNKDLLTKAFNEIKPR